MRVFTSLEEVAAASGEEIGTSDWLTIDQERVDRFADVTGDHQWIHVDVERAKEGPFGGTIAHGYLTLSLIPFFGSQVFAFETPGAKLNYGANKVRFPAPLKVGSKVRMHAVLTSAEDVPGGVQLTTTCTFEVEGGEKPVCVAETLTRVFSG